MVSVTLHRMGRFDSATAYLEVGGAVFQLQADLFFGDLVKREVESAAFRARWEAHAAELKLPFKPEHGYAKTA